MEETTNYGLKLIEDTDDYTDIFDDHNDSMQIIDTELAKKLESVPVMTGASALTDGNSGLAPKPLAGELNRFLRADGTWTVPAGSEDSHAGIYTVEATIPVSMWTLSNDAYTVTISDTTVIATMTILEWEIVNETEANPLMLGETEISAGAGAITIATDTLPEAEWRIHIDLGTDGSRVLEEVSGKANQETVCYSEGTNYASRAIESGSFVIWNESMYRATQDIDIGEAFGTSNLESVADGGLNYLQKNIWETIYPVGAIYMSVVSTSPATLFGGTWEQLKDRFLLGAGDTYTAGNTGGAASQSYTPAGTVGSHTLTTNEIPSHSHGLNSHTHSVGAHSHGLNSHTHSVGEHAHGLNSHTHTIPALSGTAASNGSHAHKLRYSGQTDQLMSKDGTLQSAVTPNWSRGVGHWTPADALAWADNDGAHTHTVSTNSSTTGKASGNTANSTAFNTGAASGSTANSTAFNTGAASGNTASAGGGGGHDHGFTGTAATINTMPPYLAVYMWKRTA